MHQSHLASMSDQRDARYVRETVTAGTLDDLIRVLEASASQKAPELCHLCSAYHAASRMIPLRLQF